jgi:hypothetical protein
MNESQTTEYVLRPGGEIWRRYTEEHQVAVPENMLAAINKDVVIPFSRLADIQSWGPMGLMVSGSKIHYVTVPVKRIILRAPFVLENREDKEKIFVPKFDSSDPAMELTWIPPADMVVLILMSVQLVKGGYYSIPKCFLFAMDDTGRYWKLPLSNIFEDCAICEGRDIKPHVTLMAAVLDMLGTFDRSLWNKDLWEGLSDQTSAMFRFKEQDGKFDQQPPLEKKWTKLCVKVATDVQKNIVL